MKTFALLLWLACRGGPADYAIPTTPEQCNAMGMAVAEVERKLGEANLFYACGFIEDPPPDSADCYP